MDELPVLDQARLNLITRGNAALANEFLGGLFEEAGELIGQLDALIASADRTALADVAHTLKGMASEVGALRLRAAAAALEAEAEPARWPGHAGMVTAALTELQSHCGRSALADDRLP